MANYYEKTSILFNVENEHIPIIISALRHLEDEQINLTDVATIDALIKENESNEPALRIATQLVDFVSGYEDGERHINFNYTELPGEGIHITTDESLNSELLAELMYVYIIEHAPDACFGYEVAITCSKPLLDGFGGYAVFVSKDGIENTGTSQWLMKKKEAFAKLTTTNETPE